MACTMTVIFWCIALITVSHASGLEDIFHPNFNISELGLPEIPRAGFPLNPMSFFSSFPFLDGLGRFKRQVEPTTGTDVEETQGELPINKNSNLVNCDTTQLSSSCLNCRQVLICSKNFGFIRSCFGRNRYCSEGRCTNEQPDNC